MAAIVYIIIFIIILFIIITIIKKYNDLIKLRNRVKNSFAQIDVQLKRRNDLIPNLVETVKGYASHEKDVFEEVTKARSNVINASGVQETIQADNQLTGALKSLFAVAENYPELKANTNFQDLQKQLDETENKIAYARQFYNDVVMMYNNERETFPNNLIANLFNFEEADFFETDVESREVPKVQF